MRGDSWTLLPAFDLNPNPSPGIKHLSTAIDGDTVADLRDALAVAPLFRLHHAQALAVLGEIRDAVRQWSQVAARHGLGKSDQAAMAPAFEHAQAERAADLLTG